MIDTIYSDPNFLQHYGVKGMKWGVRKDRRRVFVSGSSKTQDISTGHKQPLPRSAKRYLDGIMRDHGTILVGDAPGIDRQVQNYVKNYKNVEIYTPGETRYVANKKWKVIKVDAPEYEPYCEEWLAKKDVVMTNEATEGLAIPLAGGSSATRNNIDRLIQQNKKVKVIEIT